MTDTEKSEKSEKAKKLEKAEKSVICANCGIKGHYVKDCTDPITSFGIIAFKIQDKDNHKLNTNLKAILKKVDYEKTSGQNNIKFLMIQRKDTMGYIDLMRGKYDNRPGFEKSKYKKIKVCLDEMTKSEKESLLTKSFDDIWNEIWLNHKSRCFLSEYELAKKKYNSLDIKSLVSQSTITYDFTEFGYAKGRRSIRESNIGCAQREFFEETGYNNDSYNFIKNYPPIIEEFIGTNNIKYRHVYYLVKMKDNIKPPKVDTNNILQSGEVQNIGWFTLNECLALIRPYDIAKKNMIQNVYSNIVKMNNNFNCSSIYSRPVKKLQNHLLYDSIEKLYTSGKDYLIESQFT